MDKYKFIEDLTSDVLFESYGNDLKELFENSALAMFSVICKVDKVKQEKTEEIVIKGENLEDLMWNFLSYLIALVDTKEMFFSKFKIEEINDTEVKAKLYGSTIKPELGETVVKSLTMYKFKVEKTDNKYKAVISLDI